MKITKTENKTSDITNLATKVASNTKATKIEIKIPNTSHFIINQEFKRLCQK